MQELDGRVRLGKVDCSRHRQVCQAASIQAYPSVRLYTGAAADNEETQSADGLEIRSQQPQAIVQVVEEQLRLRDQIANRAGQKEQQRDEL